jgi:hypothetical protein
MEPSPSDIRSVLDRLADCNQEAAAQLVLPAACEKRAASGLGTAGLQPHRIEAVHVSYLSCWGAIGGGAEAPPFQKRVPTVRRSPPGYGAVPLALAFLLSTLVIAARPLFAQTTVGTGSIVGTVSDPSGAVVIGAKVTITNVAAGEVINLTTNSSGSFNSGSLVPGNYRTQVSAKGFRSAEAPVTVLVGNTATANFTLQIGRQDEVIEVRSSALQVNNQQPTVQGVLSEQQIENLPVNGRNFLDLAQLEPGVQIQDGADFGKDGYSSLSFGGRFGRTARIEVDGIDVSDEIFGTTTMNIPASGIQEFQLSQWSQDLSTELTTSGAINVTTRSGTNNVHGEAFGLFRDSRLAAALPAPPGLSKPLSALPVWRRAGRADQQEQVLFLSGRGAHSTARASAGAGGRPFRAIFRQPHLALRHAQRRTALEGKRIKLAVQDDPGVDSRFATRCSPAKRWERWSVIGRPRE